MAEIEKKRINCAIYTRKSTNEGLDQVFTTLDAQREASISYIASQKGEGWVALPDMYDDGGFTGANMERPALMKLIDDIKKNKIDCVVVYKVDRLSRSLIDFSKMLELFEKYSVTFVSVTQHFNTNNSMGRLTLNILLSFAQFEREIISERTKDKMAAARKKGQWLGGRPILGYDLDKEKRMLKINEKEAEIIREIFELYIKEKSPLAVSQIVNEKGYTTKVQKKKTDQQYGGNIFKRPDILYILQNIAYIGKVRYAGQIYQGAHEGIISEEVYNKASEIMAFNRRSRSKATNTSIVSLLRHLLRCKHCNKSMSPTYTMKPDGKKYRYYICLEAQRRGVKECPTRSVNADEIENAVIEGLKKIANDPNDQNQRIEALKQSINAELSQLSREQQELDEKIASITAKIIKTKESANTNENKRELQNLTEVLKDSEQQLSQLHVKKTELHERIVTKEELQKAMVITSPVWDTLFPKEKKRIIDFIIKEIDYDGATDTLGITLNDNGIKLLCAELSQANG